jgi:L,D-transpeptidase YbiS
MEKRENLLGIDLAGPVGGPGPGLRRAVAPAHVRTWVWVLLGLSGALGLGILFFVSTGVSQSAMAFDAIRVEPQPPMPLEKAAARKIRTQLPDHPYMAIDRTNNILWLRAGDGTLVREIVVSAGSGGILEDPNGKRQWIFDTPLGEFKIKGLQEDPIWIKPDWAFIEEGEPIPKNQAERAESGMLGEYAMSLGDGYLIHGTLYERLLGRNVTHGCIRVGRDNLRLVVKTVKVGDRVYIF